MKDQKLTLQKLCEKIQLQPDIAKQVLTFSSTFDFSQIEEYIHEFRIHEQMEPARIQIQNILGRDEDNIKILSCMLYGALTIHEFYSARGIHDSIYFATMRCFTRFIDECHQQTGRYQFDREWWTARQIGGHLFRIGALEYEIKPMDSQVYISIHIPSDADFSRSSVDSSLAAARNFFHQYFPEDAECPWRCHSWLLCPALKDMLPETSNILDFQKRFKIIAPGEANLEFLEWVFHTHNPDFAFLPEETTLQKNMKEYLLSGGAITNPHGLLC